MFARSIATAALAWLGVTLALGFTQACAENVSMEIANAATFIAKRITTTMAWLGRCDELDPEHAAAYDKLYQLYERSADPIMDNALRALRARLVEDKKPNQLGEWMKDWVQLALIEIEENPKKATGLCVGWLDEYGARDPNNWQFRYQWNLAGKRLREVEAPDAMKVLDGWPGSMKEPGGH